MDRAVRKNTLGQSVDSICGRVKSKKASGDENETRPFLYLVKDEEAFVVEFAHVNNEVWLPKHAALKGSARLFFVKGYNLDADWAFSDYRKFTVESHVVDAGR